jgi:hypothetical protein
MPHFSCQIFLIQGRSRQEGQVQLEKGRASQQLFWGSMSDLLNTASLKAISYRCKDAHCMMRRLPKHLVNMPMHDPTLGMIRDEFNIVKTE